MFSSDQMSIINKHNVGVYRVTKLVGGFLIETASGSLFSLVENDLNYVGQLES